MVMINVQNVGDFDVRADKIHELLTWLNNNQAAKVESVDPVREHTPQGEFTGRTLINE